MADIEQKRDYKKTGGMIRGTYLSIIGYDQWKKGGVNGEKGYEYSSHSLFDSSESSFSSSLSSFCLSSPQRSEVINGSWPNHFSPASSIQISLVSDLSYDRTPRVRR